MKPKGSTRPFVPAHKDSLKTIIDKVDGTDAAFCLAVYLALRWLANDQGAQEGPLDAPISLIAYRSGMSYNKAEAMLRVLEAHRLIVIERRTSPGTKMRATSRYSFPILEGTSPIMGAAMPTGGIPARAERLEEPKESKEHEMEEMGAASAAPAVSPIPSLEEALQYGASAGHHKDQVKAWFLFNRYLGWKMPDRITKQLKPIADWRKALDAFVPIDTERQRNHWHPKGATYTELREFVEGHNLDKATVSAWIEFQSRKHWRRKNPLNGRLEAITDWRAALLGWCRFAEENNAYSMLGE